MRETIYRGKRSDGGGWAVGYYVMADEKHYIFTGKTGIPRLTPVYRLYWDFERYEVIPETVGEYTGLEDKKGKRIFEGDIVKSPLPVGLHSNGRTKLEELVAYVFYSDLTAGFCLTWNSVCSPYRMHTSNPSKYKIIGNIHDTPGLLGEYLKK